MSVSVQQFLTFALENDGAAAIVAAADKFNVTKADLAGFAGHSVEEVDGWFGQQGIDLDAFLGDDVRNWGTDDVLAHAGVTMEQARDFLLANVGHPDVIAQAVVQTGASAATLAEIVGVTPDAVVAYAANAGFADLFAYFS